MTTDDVKAWLQTQGVSAQIQADGYIPTAPDRLVILAFTGGPGEKRERTFDVRALQVLCRGAQRNSADAETLAQQIDDIFLAITAPGATIGQTHVASVLRSGGPPAYVSRDSGQRVTYGCSYLLEAARTSF